MRRFAGCCLLLLLISGACRVAVADDSTDDKPATKILFIGKAPDHPHGSHMYLHTCGVLARCVEKTPGVRTQVSNGWPQNRADLEGVKSIVVYTNPAAELLLDGGHRGEVEQLLKQGAGLVTIHWASTVFQKNYDRLGPVWISYLGGTWISNVGLSNGKSRLKQLLPDHPVCRGWQEFELDDEYYLNPVVKLAQPLLQVREKNGQDVTVGWVYERPKGGRSFATTLGHSYVYFQDAAFRRMIVNGILWSAGVEVPAAGAPVDLDEQALALPPKP